MGKFIVISSGDTTNYRTIGESYLLYTFVAMVKQEWNSMKNATLQTARFRHIAVLIDDREIYVRGGNTDNNYIDLDTIESIFILNFIRNEKWN
mmetsp:Transcript_18802/g.28157  ORF Transcript_18802/g.28157 Transcript_18802/m.28157 type:complete len:93 (+) Transcript_18802:1216-1494(+)